MTVRSAKSSANVFHRRMLEEPTKRIAFCGGGFVLSARSKASISAAKGGAAGRAAAGCVEGGWVVGCGTVGETRGNCARCASVREGAVRRWAQPVMKRSAAVRIAVRVVRSGEGRFIRDMIMRRDALTSGARDERSGGSGCIGPLLDPEP